MRHVSILALSVIATLVGACGGSPGSESTESSSSALDFPSIQGRPGLTVRSNGEADVVARDTNNNVWYFEAQPGAAFQSVEIGLAAGSDPAIAVSTYGSTAGLANVITVNGNGGGSGNGSDISYYYAMPGWPQFQYEDLPGLVRGTITSTPAIVARPSSPELDIVVQEPDNSLGYYHTNTPGTSGGGGWSSAIIAAAGTVFSAPVIATNFNATPSNVTAYIAVQGPNHSLVCYSAKPGQSWTAVTVDGANTTFSTPAIVVRASGEVDIVSLGNSTLTGAPLNYYHNNSGVNAPGNWSSFTAQLNPSPTGNPSISVQNANNEVEVAYRGTDGTLNVLSNTPPASGWTVQSFSGYRNIAADPTIFVRPMIGGRSEADVVAESASDSRIDYFFDFNNGPWSAPSEL